MIDGRVTQGLEAVVPVTVRGRDRASATLSFTIDTGFDGYLCLPPEQVAGLDLARVGAPVVVLGDGRQAELDLYSAFAEWQGRLVPVSVLGVEGGALLGMSLLHGNRLTMDVVADGPLRIDPLAGA